MNKCNLHFHFWNEDRNGNEIESEDLIIKDYISGTSFYTYPEFSLLEDHYDYYGYALIHPETKETCYVGLHVYTIK